MKFILVLSVILYCREVVAAPLIDPALKSVLKSESVSSVDVLIQVQGIFTKGQPLNKVQPNLKSKDFNLEAKFANDELLSSIPIKKVFKINNSVLVETKPYHLNLLQNRKDILYISLDREITLPRQIIESERMQTPSEAVSDALKILQIPEVWRSMNLKGQNLRIGILDTGYAPHPDLDEKVIEYKDFTHDQTKFDGHGHGTHCLGLMAAGNLSGKALGVAPRAKYLVARVYDDQGITKLSTILEGLEWIIDPDGDSSTDDGAQIISNSWGNPVKNMASEKPLWDALVHLKKLGILSVFAAGNEGPSERSINSPGAFPHTISAGAIDRKMQVTRYSSRGPVIWEDVTYHKPDFLAPGTHIESTLPEFIYGRKTGTSMSTPLLAGSLALVKQSNPNLPWSEVLQISRQVSLDLENNGPDPSSGWGLFQTYRAAHLARNGAKVSVHVLGPNYSSKILIMPNNLRFKTRSTGTYEFYLDTGEHKITCHSLGYAPLTTSLSVNAGSTHNLQFKLEKAKIKKLRLMVFNSKGKRIPAVIEFVKQRAKSFVGVSDPMIEPLPEGVYPVIIHSRGYSSLRTTLIHNGNSTTHSFTLEIPPSIAVVDDDGQQNLQFYIAKSLSKADLEFDIISPPENLLDIEAYQILIWHLGSMGHQTINEKEQNILSEYIRKGGSLIISGQDSAYSLQDSEFLRQSLGAQFYKDDNASKEITRAEYMSKLNGEFSANNQLFTDALKIYGEDSAVYLKYRDGENAAIIKHHPIGKSLLLGFGLEGVPDSNRTQLLKTLIQDLKPSVESLFHKIEWAYANNRTSYFQIMKSLEVHEPEFAIKVRKYVQDLRKKDAWKPVLFEMFHERRLQIFDQLYDPE